MPESFTAPEASSTPGALPLLPTSVVGSHGIPGWLHVARAAVSRDEFGLTDLEELYADATRLAVDDQLRAGIDVLSDGEMRRLHFVQGFYGRLLGLAALPGARRLGSPGYDMVPQFRAVERIALRPPEEVRDVRLMPAQGLGIAEEYIFARTLADRPFKVTCPGPLMFALQIESAGGPYADRFEIAADLAGLINAELHLCFGNFHGRPRTARSYRTLFPNVLAAGCDQFLLEFAGREMSEASLWRDLEIDRELGAGVVDVKSFYADSAEQIAARIRQLLTYVPADKLWLNPDCGFNHSARWVCVEKLHALVDGAALVRQELTGGPPQRLPATA